MVRTEDSDLFFRMDLDRRCVSTCGVPSEESCDRDLSGDLPAANFQNYKIRCATLALFNRIISLFGYLLTS